MKHCLIITSGLCIALMGSSLTCAPEKAQPMVATTIKAVDTKNAVEVTEKLTGRSFTAAEIAGDSAIMPDLAIAFVDSFAIMGECDEGQKARKDIEAKRDVAAQELQAESKKLEKAKNEYVAKSTTMTDSAREKEEKHLLKMERDLKNIVAEKEEELKLDMQLATETLAQSLEAGVAQLADAENLDVVFDKMTGRAIYVAPEFDFTDKAIKEVNKKYEIKLAQNKQQTETAVKIADSKTTATPSSAASKTTKTT